MVYIFCGVEVPCSCCPDLILLKSSLIVRILDWYSFGAFGVADWGAGTDLGKVGTAGFGTDGEVGPETGAEGRGIESGALCGRLNSLTRSSILLWVAFGLLSSIQ